MSRTTDEIVHHGWDGQPAPHTPLDGDAQLLPKPIVVRGSTERPLFDYAGRAQVPELPIDFMLAPDLKGKPWRRLRGDEWTDAPMRAVAFAWIAERFAADLALTAWAIEETRYALLVRLWRGSVLREASTAMPRDHRNTYGMRLALLALESSLAFG